MLTLNEYLESAPRKLVSNLYKSRCAGRGLVNSSEAVSAVYGWASDKARLHQALNSLSQMEMDILQAVYLSENRGISEAECLSLAAGRNEGSYEALNRLHEALLIYTRKRETHSFHGFREFLPGVLEKIPQVSEGQSWESSEWTGYGSFFRNHLIFVLSRIRLGQVKMTQTGEIHRKDLSGLLEKMTFSRFISSSCPRNEFDFLFRFLSSGGFLEECAGQLCLSKQGLKFACAETNSPEREVLEWWMHQRLQGAGECLRYLMGKAQGGIRIERLSRYFWFYSETAARFSENAPVFSRENGLTWEQIPEVIREMWFLGLIEIAMKKGKICGARAVCGADEIIKKGVISPKPESHQHPTSMPNLETLLPPLAVSAHRFRVELLSERLNDENMVRHRFSKTSVIAGLQSGISYPDFLETVTWLGFDSVNSNLIREWGGCYELSSFSRVLLLRVKEKKRLEELSALPQFIALTSETIPGYGFIIPEPNKPAVGDLLNQFGLFPAEDFPKHSESRPFPQQEAGGRPHRGLSSGKIVYDVQHSEDPDEFLSGLKNRYTLTGRQPGMVDKMRIIEFAVVDEKKLELSFMGEGRKRILIHPLHLLKDSEPVKVIGVEVTSGQRNEYAVEKITSLRVVG